MQLFNLLQKYGYRKLRLLSVFLCILVTLSGISLNLLAQIDVDAEHCQKYVQDEKLLPSSNDIDKCFESDSEEEVVRDYSAEEIAEVTDWATNLSAAGDFTKQNLGKPIEIAVVQCVLSEPLQEEDPNAGWLPATQEGISQAIGFVPYAGDLGDLWTATTGFNVITFKQVGCIDRAINGVFAGIGLYTTSSGLLSGCTVGTVGGPPGCAIVGSGTALSAKATTQLLKNKVLKEGVKIIIKDIVDNAKQMGIKLVNRKLAKEITEKLVKEIQQDGLKMFLQRSGKYITAQLVDENIIKTAIKDGKFYVTLLNKKYVLRQFWSTVTGTVRPNWRQSEQSVSTILEKTSTSWKKQISFLKQSEEWGKGSVRPDNYNRDLGLALEVKNYMLNSPNGWNKLTKISKEQYQKRVINLPPNTRQKFILDIREQYLYKNPDNIAKEFATEIGINESDVFVIKTVSDLEKIKDFAK